MNRLVPVALLVPWLAACSDDAVVVPRVVEPPRVVVQSITPAGGAPWTPGEACLERGVDPAGSVAVEVGPHPEGGAETELEGWRLRPRWRCYGMGSCGYLSAEVLDPAGARLAYVEAAATHLTVPLAPVPAGAVTLVVALRWEDGSLVLDDAGTPIAETLDLTLAAPGGC